MASTGHSRRRTVVLHEDDVVDDETLHPGAVVWLGEPPLRPDELARFEFVAIKVEPPPRTRLTRAPLVAARRRTA